MSIAAAPRGLPRLLLGMRSAEPLEFHQHVGLHGERPLLEEGRNRRRRAGCAEQLLREVELSGLRGRGGGGFPLAAKLHAVAAAGRRAVVIANGSEGEPASNKDRTLMEGAPHLVLDGVLLAAEALNAEEGILCVCESAPLAADALAGALEERARHEPASAPRLSVIEVSPRYITGQETALIDQLQGGPGLPTFTPPRPFEGGLRGRPTLVSNVETLAHLALLARHGPDWFSSLGTADAPGSMLVSVGGAVRDAGVYEIEAGLRVRELIAAAGGATGPIRALLVGGYAGGFIDGQLLDGLELSPEALQAHGARLGAGIVFALSDECCPVAETVALADWLARQSARQCGPCLQGLDALAGTIAQVARGGGGLEGRLAQLSGLTRGRGACTHPDGSVRLLESALRTFGAEFADHARHGPCRACAHPPSLPLGAGRVRR